MSSFQSTHSWVMFNFEYLCSQNGLFRYLCSGVFINTEYWYLGLTLPGIEGQYDPGNKALVRYILTILYFIYGFITVNVYTEVLRLKDSRSLCWWWNYCFTRCIGSYRLSNYIAVCGEQVAVLTFFTLLTLYANIIPISLYVSIEVFVFYVLLVPRTTVLASNCGT